MTHPNYRKGRRKEYAIVKEAKAKGCLAVRSAGSHSPVDVWIVDHKHRIISLVQAKPDDMPEITKKRLEEKYAFLNGIYKVRFVVL